MLKVLLVIEDYNELVYIQGLLRKLGFDVDGMQNQRKLSESLMIFRPQVVITTSRGKQVDGVAVCQKITKRNGWPKIIFIDNPITAAMRTGEVPAAVDHVLQSPVSVPQVISVLSDYGNLDKETLLAKFAKFKGQTNNEEVTTGRLADGGEGSSVKVFKGQTESEEKTTLAGDPDHSEAVVHSREQSSTVTKAKVGIHHNSAVESEEAEGVELSGGQRAGATKISVGVSKPGESTQGSEPQSMKAPNTPAGKSPESSTVGSSAVPQGTRGGQVEVQRSQGTTGRANETPAQRPNVGSAVTSDLNSGAVTAKGQSPESESVTRASKGGSPSGSTTKTSGAATSMTPGASTSSPVHSVPNIAPTVISMEDRRQRFAKIIEEVSGQKKTHFNPEKVREFHKKIRDAENQDQTQDLEEERKNFVVALFAKK